MPPDWAFGAEAPTLGKAMARWAMHLYLGVADSPMRRYVLDDDELDDWRWLPDTGCAAEPRPRHGWLTYDVCEAAERRLRKPQAWLGDAVTGTKGGAALLGQLQGNSSGRWRQRGGAAWMATAGGGVTSGGVWAAAQALRLVRSSLGPCGRAAEAELWRRQPSSLLRQALPREQRAGGRGAGLLGVGVQVRRGDACERWAAAGDGDDLPAAGGRPCYRAAEYVSAAAAVLARLRARLPPSSPLAGREPVLLLASDSPRAEHEVREAMRSSGAMAGVRLLAVAGDSREAAERRPR